MRITEFQEIVAPFAWGGAELQERTDWIRPFRPEELAEINTALAGVKRRRIDWLDITRRGGR